MIPSLSPVLQAAVDLEREDIKGMVNDFPAYAVLMQTAMGAAEVGRFVANDLLARLAECADLTPEMQLLIVVARLHAWQAETQ